MIQQNQQTNKTEKEINFFLKEINYIDTLDKDKAKLYKKFYDPKCCYGNGIIAEIRKTIVMVSMDIAFVISAFCLLIHNNKAYKDYRDIIILNPLSNYEIFWCDFGQYENGILISYFILLILVLLYEIVSLLIHYNVIKVEIGQNFFYKMIILINFIFEIIFSIYFFLLLYLFSLSILVFSTTPLDFREEPTVFTILNRTNTTTNTTKIERQKTSIEIKFDEQLLKYIIYILIILIIIVLNLFVASLEDTRNFYLNFDFKHKNDNEQQEIIKSTKMLINDHYYDIKIKKNKKYLSLFAMLYNYKYSGHKTEINLNINLIYKEILIEGITDNFIFIKTVNKAINDQLSLVDFEYPIFHEIFFYLSACSIYILFILSLSLAFFKLHITNEKNYKIFLDFISQEIIEKPKYYSIFKMCGNFEKNITDSRFILYLISFFITIFFIIKRMFFGGFIKYIYLTISFILSIIFIIINVIYMILSLLLVIFGGMCHINFEDLSRDDYLIRNKILVHCFLNSFCFIFFIPILVYNSKIYIYLRDVINDYGILSKDENILKEINNEDISNILYIDKNIKACTLEELQIVNFPKKLFFKQPKVIISDNNNSNNINNETNNNANNNNIDYQNRNDIYINPEDLNIKNIGNKIDKDIKKNIDTKNTFDINSTRNEENPPNLQNNQINVNTEGQLKSSEERNITNNPK